MQPSEIIPTEKVELSLIKAPVLYRRMREHGTRSEQFLLQIPTDLLDQQTDTNTNKKFRVQLGVMENKKRVVVVFLDDFIFPTKKPKESDLYGK